jgi:1-pyrroline-5-carboxylate dehydrogenase
MDAVSEVPVPANEPVEQYAANGEAQQRLLKRVAELAATPLELTATIGGERRPGGGAPVEVVQPHHREAVLGELRHATEDDTRAAVKAATEAARTWRDMPYDDRAAIFLRAADLLSGPWRDTLNAATMLGQSKTMIQAEVDSACELIDFWRFNVSYGRRILAEQPRSSAGVWNRMDHRPLEGFVYAVTPFNFTAIAGNLPTAPALMGNVVLWKPSPTQQFAAHFTMRLLEEAGLPPGVINMLPGDGLAVSTVALADPGLAGIHFTGSTGTFRTLWRTVGENLDRYRSYPRIVGETGGKDFVVAHPSADVDVLTTALIRGAFEYQGQKCSAASRAYLPRSLWQRMRKDFLERVAGLRMGDVTDPRNFLGAVIDQRAHRRLTGVLAALRDDAKIKIEVGGTADDTTGWFVEPTVVTSEDAGHDVFATEYFGPVLAIHVYDDADWERILQRIDSTSPYGLTGAVIARDRDAIATASDTLRFAAGNFYVNDRPTGAVVGQQPFGGGRASGTNDKAGSIHNLMRWVSPRSIKETFVPPTDHRYPHQG